MIDFTALMAGMTADGDTSSVTVTEDWLQGRTIHGGLSAAFCLTSVGQQFGDLPPLRSAQFGFVGPAEGTVMIRPTVLRRGKSTVLSVSTCSQKLVWRRGRRFATARAAPRLSDTAVWQRRQCRNRKPVRLSSAKFPD